MQSWARGVIAAGQSSAAVKGVMRRFRDMPPETQEKVLFGPDARILSSFAAPPCAATRCKCGTASLRVPCFMCACVLCNPVAFRLQRRVVLTFHARWVEAT